MKKNNGLETKVTKVAEVAEVVTLPLIGKVTSFTAEAVSGMHLTTITASEAVIEHIVAELGDVDSERNISPVNGQIYSAIGVDTYLNVIFDEDDEMIGLSWLGWKRFNVKDTLTIALSEKSDNGWFAFSASEKAANSAKKAKLEQLRKTLSLAGLDKAAIDAAVAQMILSEAKTSNMLSGIFGKAPKVASQELITPENL